jgi:hypothetical protein
MTTQFSTGLRNLILGGTVGRHVASITHDGIAAVDGGASADTFTDDGNGFITAGFNIGDSILVFGFAGANANSHGPFILSNVEAGTLTVPTGSIIASEVASEAITIVALIGGSVRDIFKRGVLRIYSGTQPTTADLAATGTKLLEITVGSAAFTGGAVAAGLEFAPNPAAGVLAKLTSQTWSGVGLVTGVAGWFRFYANGADEASTPAISTTLPRIDGSVAVSGAQLNMASTTVTLGATSTIDTFTVTLPLA